MPLNPEMLLIAKILETGNLKPAIDAGLEPHHFVDQTCADHYAYLLEYYTDIAHPHSVPTPEIFKLRFPNDPMADPKGRTTVEEYVEQARNKQLALGCKTLAEELSLAADSGDPKRGLENAVGSASLLLGRDTRTRDITMSGHAQTIIKDYQLSKGGKMKGIPWPWEPLNKMTQGLERGNLILYYGRPKQMKSWVALVQAAHFYERNMRGGKVLVVTLEMAPELVARRIAAYLTRMNYEKLMQGQLKEDEEEIFVSSLTDLAPQEAADMHEGKKKEFIIAAPEGDMSVLEIENKIDKYKPDLVVIDGIYLLSDARTKKSGVDWKILANVSRDLKQLAQRQAVPIVGVHQANRKSDGDTDDLSDIAFTDSYARDADVLIKCIKIDHYNMGSIIALLFSGAREFKMAGFYIHGKPAHNFEYIQNFESKEQLLAFVEKSKRSHKRDDGGPKGIPDVKAAREYGEGRRKNSVDMMGDRFGKKK